MYNISHSKVPVTVVSWKIQYDWNLLWITQQLGRVLKVKTAPPTRGMHCNLMVNMYTNPGRWKVRLIFGFGPVKFWMVKTRLLTEWFINHTLIWILDKKFVIQTSFSLILLRLCKSLLIRCSVDYVVSVLCTVVKK